MRSLASSRSTGNLPIGHGLDERPALASPRLTACGVNSVSFSYSAINTFQQSDDGG